VEWGVCTVVKAGEEIDDAPKELNAPRTRRKLSGVELEARFENWCSEQREKREARTDEDAARTIRRGLSAVMGTAIVGLVVASAVTGNGFDATRSAGETKIASLQSQVSDAEALPADPDLSGKLTALSEAAATDAGKVRDAQHAYARLYHESSTQAGIDDGAPNKAMIATAEHGRTLAPLFSEDSYLVDDQDAYTWHDGLPFDAGTEIDPRFAWYVRYDGLEASAPSAYAWKVETVMPDLGSKSTSGAADQAKVVWLCRDAKSGEVLAWASAVYAYDGTSGLFSDLDVVVTAAGAEYANPAAKKPDGSDVPELSGSGAQKNGGKR
jgi:hypothetical protein